MCIIAVKWRPSATSGYKLVLAANRDEMLNRPSAPATPWKGDLSHIIAGRDLDPSRPPNGTWLGINKRGYVACLTNIREKPSERQPKPRGRGELATGYLMQHSQEYLDKVLARADEYEGFNLLTFDLHASQAQHTTNRAALPPTSLSIAQITMTPGTHVMTNGMLDAEWVKAKVSQVVADSSYHWRRQGLIVSLQALKLALTNALDGATDDDKDALTSRLLTILSDDTRCCDASKHPPTGMSNALEEQLSSIYIKHEPLAGYDLMYGTRAQTVILIDADDNVHFCERSWQPSGEWITSRYDFKIDPEGT
eukprot:TRINITY_DN11381_c0_g1_i2.p1 TRINITY_DN11381_c0_g1~~TRINITY_DN11381_c0_g1_i2.p1  ORF type:complete len:309 (+),score=34.97 TRINITY_DN11381_c0_g1_i2:31-957(+)